MKYLPLVPILTLLYACDMGKRNFQIEKNQNLRFLLIEKVPSYSLTSPNNNFADRCRRAIYFSNKGNGLKLDYSDFLLHKDTCKTFTIKNLKNINPNKRITTSSMLDSMVNRNYGALLNHDFYLIDARTTPIQVSKVVYKMPMADRGHPDEPDQLITPKEWPVKTKE